MRKIFSVSIFMFILLFAFTGCASQKLTDELVKSVEENQIAKVDELLKNNGKRININVLDENGRSLLMNAIINSKETAILYSLMDNNINLDLQDKDGKTALMYAAEDGNATIIHALIKRGCNVNLKDKDNNTALLCLSKIGANKNVVELNILDSLHFLVDGKADVNVQDKDGKTPLFYIASTIYIDKYSNAPSSDREKYISYLLNSGANEAITDNNGFNYKYYSEKTESEIEKIEYSQYIEKYINNGKKSPKIGMTADEVLNSTWGDPEDINKTTTKYGTSEQWVYNLGKYIYLDNGIVTAIQE